MANGGSLLSVFRDFLSGRVPTEDLLKVFVDSQLTAANLNAVGSETTILYSGKYNTDAAYKMAIEMAEQSGGKIGILDKTKLGEFLLYISKPENTLAFGFENPISKATGDYIFDTASAKFIANAQGNIVTMTSTSVLDSTWNRAEVDAIIGNTKITHVNGVDLAPFRTQWNKIGSDTARRKGDATLFNAA
jgi:hypothetical protein